jgi:hypothetical protein
MAQGWGEPAAPDLCRALRLLGDDDLHEELKRFAEQLEGSDADLLPSGSIVLDQKAPGAESALLIPPRRLGHEKGPTWGPVLMPRWGWRCQVPPDEARRSPETPG